MAIRAGVVAVTLLLLCGKSTAVGGVAPADQQEVQVRLEHGGVVRALIDPRHGGELSGLSVLIDGRWHELIYRAADYSSSPGWRGKAPLLWPATGVSISEQGEKGRYAVDGKEYEMPMHGFARFSAWKVLQAQTESDSSVAILELTESESSLEIYPFAFSLQVEYRLDDCGLQLRYRVAASADNERAMPFSIGNHITFRVPLVEASAPGETTFQTNLPREHIVDARRVFTGQTRASAYTGRHSVGELPHRRAVSLGGDVSWPSITVFDPSGFHVELAHEVPPGVSDDTIKLNLWADLDEGFFSPEPWIGAQNSLNSGLGLVRLEPGREWEWRIRIRPSTLVACESEAASS